MCIIEHFCNADGAHRSSERCVRRQPWIARCCLSQTDHIAGSEFNTMDWTKSTGATAISDIHCNRRNPGIHKSAVWYVDTRWIDDSFIRYIVLNCRRSIASRTNHSIRNSWRTILYKIRFGILDQLGHSVGNFTFSQTGTGWNVCRILDIQNGGDRNRCRRTSAKVFSGTYAFHACDFIKRTVTAPIAGYAISYDSIIKSIFQSMITRYCLISFFICGTRENRSFITLSTSGCWIWCRVVRIGICNKRRERDKSQDSGNGKCQEFFHALWDFVMLFLPFLAIIIILRTEENAHRSIPFILCYL